MTAKTAFYELHQKWGGKLVEFADTWLPIQYPTGIIKEHLAVRNHAGLFDVSHMGEFLVEGKQAPEFLDVLLTNKISNLKLGQMRYSCCCYPDGTTVDDLIVYRFSEDRFLCVVNASNRQKDWDWFVEHKTKEIQLQDVSNHICQLALQGPKAIEILGQIADLANLPTKTYWFTEEIELCNKKCLISRNGYTGEDGVEIYMKNEDGVEIAQAIMKAGEPFGLLPCGLGARDTLRLEAAMPLYGQELDDQTTPLEAGLGFAVKLDKENFIGKQALIDKPVKKVRVGLEIVDRGIAREHYEIVKDDQLIGHVSSGTMSPVLSKAIAMAYVPVEFSQDKTEVLIRNKNREMKAVITAMPFYKRK